MAPKIHYIGIFDFAAEGKNLWEILCQLKGLGVGRYVTKTEWSLKWPDYPSYLKIVKARPEMDRWLNRGKVWAEWTFRGQKLGVYEFNNDLNRADWKLIHKHEEPKFLQNNNKMGQIEIPDTFPLPPLQVLIAKRYAEKIGQPWDKKQERAPLDVCIDPQFEIYRKFIRQKKPNTEAVSIYEEIDPEVYLNFYGEALPTKIDYWDMGKAEYIPQFTGT